MKKSNKRLIDYLYKIKAPKLQEYHDIIDSAGHEWTFLPMLRNSNEVPISYDVYCLGRYAIIRANSEVIYLFLDGNLWGKEPFEVFKEYGKYSFKNIISGSTLIGGRNWYKEIEDMKIKPRDIPENILKLFEPYLDKIMVDVI